MDASRLSLPIVVVAPERKVNPETGAVKTDRDGNIQWRTAVSVAAMGRRMPDVIDVTTSTEPVGVAVGTPVKLVNLAARPWQMGDRSGLSFSADEITPAVSPGASVVNNPAPAPKPGSGKGGDAS
ncbi:MAG: hypothetical protein HOY79_18935 [Streptomyces sp.]|nr:hypothetical protein [Streptomyces sp.]